MDEIRDLPQIYIVPPSVISSTSSPIPEFPVVIPLGEAKYHFPFSNGVPLVPKTKEVLSYFVGSLESNVQDTDMASPKT